MGYCRGPVHGILESGSVAVTGGDNVTEEGFNVRSSCFRSGNASDGCDRLTGVLHGTGT